jgi:predicted lipoprotein with Yx(FWY)xxD motif
MIKTTKKVFLTLLSMFVAFSAFAQVTTSSMSGKITEANGSPAAGAAIIATHVPTGALYYAVSDNNGNYRILNMRPGGPYNVVVKLLGYQTVETQGISIALADNYVMNTSLKEEAIGLNAIIVSAIGSKSNMKSDRAGAITSIDMKTMESLPTITRSMNDMIKLTPQVYVSSNGPQIGGASYRSSFVTVDGAAFNNAFGIGQNLPANGSPISLDAIEQISISVTPYDVRQSGFTGGSINAVTRSGSNNLEASVYTYYNDDSFRGNKVGKTTFNLSDSKYLVYGFRVGAPIIKDKLFLFINAEKESSTEPGPSSVAATATKPFTTGSDNVARPTETALNAISNFLKNTYNYDPGLYQGYSSESPGQKFLARLDWNINKNNKFNIRYSNTKKKNPSFPSTSTSGLGNTSFTSQSRTSIYAKFFQNARYYQETNFSSVAGELNSRLFGGKLNNTLRVSYSHQYEPRSTEGGEFPFVDIVVNGMTYTSFGTELFSFGNLRDVSTWNFTDELAFSLGKHSFTGGVQYETNHTKNGFQRFGTGYFTFKFNSETDLLNAINAGTVFNTPYQFAITHSMNEDFSQAYPEFTFNQLSLYLQDEYTFSDRFKVLGGLRIELPSYPALNTYNAQVAGITFEDYKGSLGKYSTDALPKAKIMWSPRVGFNFDVLGDRKIVLRGGTGLFTGRIPFVWIVAQAGDAGVLQRTYTAVSGDGKTIPTLSANRIDMLNQIYPNWPNISGSAANITYVSIMDKDLKMPQTWKSSLAIDMKLPGNVMASVEGIYNQDVNSVTVRNIGLTAPVSSAISNYTDNRLYYGSYYDNTLKNAYLLHNADHEGYYYSITAKLEKNNWHGLSGMAAYTYSKAKSLGDGFGDQVTSAYQNANNVNGMNQEELGSPSYVMPHRIIGSLSYSIQYAKHFATSIGLFYEGGPQSRASYTYTANVLGDGSAYTLIYVPKSENELTFSNYTYTDKNGTTQTYTAAQQAADFWKYVNQDKYLKTRKGQYAERNGLVYPWIHQFDLKINQDYFMKIAGKQHKIQLGLDILNVGNLINKNWGKRYSINRSTLLKVASNAWGRGSTAQPVFQFQRNGTEVLSETFTPTLGTSSTYYMQLSLRYIFN